MGCVLCSAQSVDSKVSVFAKPGEDDNEDHPKNFRESMQKMQIEKEKKELRETIDRGNQAVKITEQLENSYIQNGRLTESELERLLTVEKLVKKIRDDLGGDDDDDDKEQTAAQVRSMPIADALKTLVSNTVNLYDELQKTTRFSISAAAIQSSNAVLRFARFMRVTR